MTRIFWDAMLFIYLLDRHPQFESRVRELLHRSLRRKDVLLTSSLALGEVMAGAGADPARVDGLRTTISSLGFRFLPFEEDCATVFARLRASEKLKAPDAIHLACAATAGVDMFLTGDAQLLKRRLHVPGIHFIADFTLPLL